MSIDPLSSPSIGTATDDLISDCPAPPIAAMVPVPPAPPAVGFAVALSGGGFRASLAALGVLRLLADAGQLGNVRYVSSVSGGSIASGLFAVAYPELSRRGFSREAFDELVLRPIVARITGASLQRRVIFDICFHDRIFERSRVLTARLDSWFYGRTLLRDLPTGVRFIFNAANAATGVRFGFEQNRCGDRVMGYTPTADKELLLADAVAASSCFPPAFTPVELPAKWFPCPGSGPTKLLDGGAYDNLGLEPLDGGDNSRQPTPANAAIRDCCLVVMNSGGQFHVGGYGEIPAVSDLLRTTSLLYRQTTALRTRWLVERFLLRQDALAKGLPAPPQSRRGILLGLGSDVTDAPPDWIATNAAISDAERYRLATMATSLDKFSLGDAEALVRRGWWLAGARLAKYEPGLLAPPYPVWAPLARVEGD